MSKFRPLTVVEQLAEHLRRDLEAGELGGMMPGVLKLEANLGVNRKTVDAALRILETKGVLIPQGMGRRRLIRLPKATKPNLMRVAILLHERANQHLDYVVELGHELREAGHAAFHSPESLTELGMNVKRVARVVNKTEADAWLVISGSREILEWFSARKTPVFSLFGRRRGLPIASVGPDKPPAIRAAARELIGLGHRRIALMAQRSRRIPEPGASERAFLDELAVHEIEPGPFHLPDWEASIDGFHECLHSLFHITPPTALIIDEAPFFIAAFQFCANRGLRVPQDVSLVCTDADPAFAWCRPSVAHIRWDSRPVVRRIVRWAANVSRGKEDKRQTLTPAEFVSGGTIGPAKEP